MGIRGRLRRPVERVLATQGVRFITGPEAAASAHRYRRAIAQLCGCMTATVLPGLEPTEERIERIAALRGTDPAEGWFLLARLLAALEGPGDVCEFGVAQGHTSVLLAGELLPTDRHLWLYDSFEGLPPPTTRDVLIDDPLDLGSIENYAGQMAYGREAVEDRLRAVGFPHERTHVVAGFVTEELHRSLLPAAISFAYVDFDFHDAIAAALVLVDERLTVGGNIVIDDYGYLSTGAKTATDSFLEAAGERYEVDIAPDWAGHFCMLHRTDRGQE